MTTAVAIEIRCKTVSEERNAATTFEGKLDSAELLTGTPTVTVVTVTVPAIVISNIAVNTSALTINGRTVAIGKAVTFKVTGGLVSTEEDDPTTYTIRITAVTDAAVAQTLITNVCLQVIGD